MVGLEMATSLINGGDLLIIDGETGEVVINPTEEVSQSFLERKRRTRYLEREVLKYASLPAETQDGVRIRLQANIEMVDEIPSAKDARRGRDRALPHGDPLSQSEGPSRRGGTFRGLSTAGGKRSPATATIRTLDIGGDKFLSDYPKGNEINPAMGLRAIRFSIKEIGDLQDPAPGDSAGQRLRQAEDSFPDDFGSVKRSDRRRPFSKRSRRT